MRANSSDVPKFSIWTVLEFFGWDLPAPRGGWQSIKCEKHGDTHNSASISEEAEFIFCHACDFKGDAINVVMIYEGVSFGEAKSRCTEITGSDIQATARRGGGRDRRGARSYKPPRLRR